MSTAAPLPSSGDPGGRPPRPETLPAPALWPQGQGAEEPFDGLREETVPSRDAVSVGGAYGAALLMVVGAVLLGVAAVLVSWPLGLAGVVTGLVGLVLAWRVKIFAAVQLGAHGETSPGGPAAP